MTPMLATRGLRVAYGGLVAVVDADFAVDRGQIHGVIGPNGAGKTTFFNAISGLVKAGAGSVLFDGQDITDIAAYQRALIGIRRTFQSVQLIASFTVLENVLAGLHLQGPDGSSWMSGRSERWRQDRVRDALEFMGIGHLALERPEALTFAQQRFVEIARAIVAKPKVILFDEPAAGLSPTEIGELDALIRRIKSEHSVAIVLIEHVLSLVLEISDRVTVFDRGRIIASGTPAAIREDPAVKSAYLGGEHA